MSNWNHVGQLEQIIRSSSRDKESVNNARILLLQLYEDVLLNDLEKAVERNIDDRMWAVFHKHIEFYRSQIRTSPYALKAELATLLQSAIAFYSTIIIELEARGDVDLIELALDERCGEATLINHQPANVASQNKWKSVAFGCVIRCLIYLGDLSRYEDDIARAQCYYRKCIALSPAQGKPYSQLAIISLSKQDHLDSIYWFSLALCTSQPFSVARDNLAAVMGKVLQSGPSTENLGSVVSFYRLAFVVESEQKPNLVLEHANIMEYVDNAVEEMDYKKITKVLVLLMIAMHELEKQFTATDKTVLKSRIRSFQVVVVSVIIGVMSACLSSLTDRADTAEEQPLQEFIINASLDATTQSPLCLLEPVSIGAAYLTQNMGTLHLIVQYGSQVEGFDSNRFLEILLAFCYPIRNIMNAARSVLLDDEEQNNVGDRREEEITLLPEDSDLMGFVKLLGFYRSVNRDVFKQYLRNLRGGEASHANIKKTIRRLGRIHHLASRLAHDERFEMFKYDAKDGFLVMDVETKQRIRAQQSEALARQFQNQQMEEAKKSTRPVVVVDAGVLVDHLWMVKKWLSRGKCFVVIAKAVLEHLDRMKKGTSEQSINARAATRFLEHQITSSSPYWRQFLRLQAPQQADLTDRSLAFVSKYDRHFIACAIYFHKQVVAQPFNTEEMFRVVYTDDRIRVACEACHLPASCLKEWDDSRE